MRRNGAPVVLLTRRKLRVVRTSIFYVIELKYGGMVKSWKFEWGSLSLWVAERTSPFGRYRYGYFTVYVRAKFAGVAAGGRRWLQKTVYVGKDAVAVAGKLVATTPWLSWGEAVKKAREAVRALLGQIEAAFSALKQAKREFRQALWRGADEAEAKFDSIMEGVEALLDGIRGSLKDALEMLPEE